MSLLAKFFLTFACTFPIIFIIFLAYTVNSTYEDEMNALKLHAKISTELQASALANPVWNLNEASINEIIQSLKTDPSFISSTLLLPQGESQLGQTHIDFVRNPEETINPSNIVEYRSPITLPEQGNLGILKNQFSSLKIYQNYSNDIAQGIGELFLLLSSIAMILYYTLRILIMRPLNSLIGTMEQVTSGDLTAQANITTQDEMGRMAQNFEKMRYFLTNTLEQLNKSRQDLKQYAETLEVTVAKRTHDLQLSNEDLKKTVDELKIAKDEATQANLTKSQFLANMSHELRTPLNAIIGYSEMIEEECAERGLTFFSSDLDKISMSGKHLLSLINDILDLSKIEAGKMTIYLEDIPIISMIHDVNTIAQPLVTKNNNMFNLEYPEALESTIMHTDAIKVRQCILNLISNASKFTENGTITLSINLSGKEGKQMVSFAVQDTGIGIPSEQLNRLFKSFSQVDSQTTRKYGGTGLGLYLTERFCNALGGHVTVDSAVDKGSIFTIFLPLVSKPFPERSKK
jgi:signal transduction histidine kinase